MCLFDKAVQKAKGGGGETNIGQWGKWTSSDSMVYEGGAQCWNGPKRSLRVGLECGEANEAESVSEPSKCEYVMKIKTPAACNLGVMSHDEL